jgi:hypothetical protein
MTGRQVVAAVVVIVLATAVVPPAAAWAVNRRRIAHAARDVDAIARRFHAAGGDPIPAGAPARLVCLSGKPPAGVSQDTYTWNVEPPVAPDPWGNCYLLQFAMPGGVHPGVRVISAGPNGTIETPLVGAAGPGGDDVVQFF